MMRGRGGTADALASGASGGNPVEVQILSTAPFLSITVIFNHNAVVAERQTHHLEGVAGRPVWVQIPPTAPYSPSRRSFFLSKQNFLRKLKKIKKFTKGEN